jgi:hypothetical protein
VGEGARPGSRGRAPFPPRRAGGGRPRPLRSPASQSVLPPWGFLKNGGCLGWGVQGGRSGGGNGGLGVRRPGVDSERRSALGCARRRFPRWSDCTAHRREHKVNADCATAGTCEPGAPCGRGASPDGSGGAAFAERVACDVLPEPDLAGAHRRSRGRRVHGARHGAGAGSNGLGA